MIYEEAFKYISKKFKTNDFLIAGGSVYRAFHREDFHASGSDIDVFLSRSCFVGRSKYDLMTKTEEYFINSRLKKSKNYPSESYKFFDSHLRKNIEYIVIDDDVFDKGNIVKHFDLNCSRYYWNSAKEVIENEDPYPNEIAIMKLKPGYTFQRLFERVSKYRQIMPKAVVFRVEPELTVTITNEKTKKNIMDGY